VIIDLEAAWFSPKKPTVDHQEIIKEHARDGWRLVQIFAPMVSVVSGGTSDYEIIFEREG